MLDLIKGANVEEFFKFKLFIFLKLELLFFEADFRLISDV